MIYQLIKLRMWETVTYLNENIFLSSFLWELVHPEGITVAKTDFDELLKGSTILWINI